MKRKLISILQSLTNWNPATNSIGRWPSTQSLPGKRVGHRRLHASIRKLVQIGWTLRLRTDLLDKSKCSLYPFYMTKSRKSNAKGGLILPIYCKIMLIHCRNASVLNFIPDLLTNTSTWKKWRHSRTNVANTSTTLWFFSNSKNTKISLFATLKTFIGFLWTKILRLF